MRLRLYHHADGARIAYRQAGTGPPLVLLHAAGLSHREWEPVAGPLSEFFRVVLPDLPLHGDSEDRPGHPYTPAWLCEVLAGFCAEVAGPSVRLGGHGSGAELALRATAEGHLTPAKLVLAPNRMHRRAPAPRRRWRVAVRAAGIPGLARPVSHMAARAARPGRADRWCTTRADGARDLVRHAVSDLPGNTDRARGWARAARAWPLGPQHQLLDAYGSITCPVLLLWTDADPRYPLEAAREALDLLPDAQLRVLSDCGPLLTFDDPVGVTREIAAFCR
jgi:pimeloyl-ACP methyl ester carboxylesterase